VRKIRSKKGKIVRQSPAARNVLVAGAKVNVCASRGRR